MNWEELLGHQRQRHWFQRALDNGRLANSFLFVGSEGIGKRTFARLIAKSLLCRGSAADTLEFCDRCEDCAQVEASTHPDLIEVSKPEEKSFLPLELLIGEATNRNREGLCHELSLKPHGGRRKIAIVDDADYLNAEGANCLLKTLEEPPPRSLLMLIGTSVQRQLPTIRSRCQILLFQPLAAADLATLLVQQGIVEAIDEAHMLASMSSGSLEIARGLADPALHQFRSQLWNALGRSPLPIVQLTRRCEEIVNEAGKEARPRRDRLKLIAQMAAEFFRAVILLDTTNSAAAESLVANAQLRQSVRQALAQTNLSRERALAAWQRCLAAIEQVDRNANQSTLIESWFCDMAHACQS